MLSYMTAMEDFTILEKNLAKNMVQKFKRTFGCTYSYSESWESIPDKVKNAFSKGSFQINQSENFICACWIDQALTPYNTFVIVTSLRVYSKKTTGIEQNYFEGITGIEKTMLGNIEVLSAGNKSVLFVQANIPSKDLIKALYDKLNSTSMSLKNSQNGTKANTPDPYERLEKLAELKSKGLLTEEEFDQKRKTIIESI